MRPIVKLYKLGRVPYQKALNVQLALFDNLKQNVVRKLNHYNRDCSASPSSPNAVHSERLGANSLVLVEHDPVYTVGIRTRQYNDDYIAKLKETLDEHQLSADFFKTNRGGLVTFHGPGQLVAYPIINLGTFTNSIENRSVKAYVSALERVIIDTLERVGLPGAHTVKEYPGVWLDNGERKIAFIGISCKRFVTMHGVSINCDCDLSWFDHIISCGIEDKSITSIKRELLTTSNKESNIVTNCDNNNNKMIKRKTGLEHLTNFRSDCVDHIANQFCVSFSHQFKCDLQEEEFPWDMVDRSLTDRSDGYLRNLD